MIVSLWLFVSSIKAIVLTGATVVAIAIVFLTPNFTIITNAQQQQQSLPTSSQSSLPPPSSAVTQSSGSSPTLLNKMDSFRVQLPEGWVIQDINNTGFTMAAEVVQGYGILAELCPQQDEQSVSSNASGSSSSNRYIGSCQHAGQEVIHIIRYPNLGARLGIPSDEDTFSVINNRDTLPNAVLAYHFQKLSEVGYRDFKIVNSIDTTMNVDNSTIDLSNGRMAARTTTTVPAKFVEMTYNTNFAPNETRIGYFLLTATATTPRNLGTMTGYSIFYEGNSTANATTTVEQGTTATISTGSTIASPASVSLSSKSLLPAPVKQVFDSFELIAARTEPLTVEITSEDTEGIAPATFEFEADVAGGMEPYTISWDYGDDNSSGEEEEEENDEDIEHTFDIAGTYTVGVSVTDSTGRTASDSMLIFVDEPPPLTAVDIISNGTEGIAPATFEFEADVTGGIEPYIYRWNFGDGSRTNDDDEDIEHTFDIAGIYNVSLIVIDSTGRAASDSMLIFVDEPPPPPPLILTQIIPSGTEGIAPATFEFEADVAGGTGPYTYRWYFGDGTRENSDDETISHTFEEAGTYNVSLIVIDSTGRAISGSILIIVEAPPPPLTAVDIISNGTGGIAPATFEFEAHVAGGTGPYTYSWGFGDDGSSRESNTQTILHTFEEAGRYNVGVTVIDSRNQIASDSIVITVEVEEEEPSATEQEEQPILSDDVDDNSRSDAFFDLDDSQNNGITVGGTSAADDYDTTAED
ncbi:MAG TPA: PKD domain-containing protein [Nitrososphaeraceae archaeon]|nr:PKD domain-containing protein [Nitrososphaeraceae archaeon]